MTFQLLIEKKKMVTYAEIRIKYKKCYFSKMKKQEMSLFRRPNT